MTLENFLPLPQANLWYRVGEHIFYSYGGKFREYGLSDKILNKFLAVTMMILERNNYLDFCQTSHILEIYHHNV